VMNFSRTEAPSASMNFTRAGPDESDSHDMLFNIYGNQAGLEHFHMEKMRTVV
jgi:hypothetical protein